MPQVPSVSGLIAIRRWIGKAAALALLWPLLVGAAGPGESDALKPSWRKSVVLVHGAFADGSCWNEVIRLLQARGIDVTAVQNPLNSLAGDVHALNKVLNQQTRPVVLVGHSWGGMVITEGVCIRRSHRSCTSRHSRRRRVCRWARC